MQRNKTLQLYISIIIGLMVFLVYLLVIATGGIRFVYSHTMYIPILLAALVFGVKGGIIVGFIAGILLGPIMPVDTATAEMQDFLNWFYRLFIFLIVGSVFGGLFDRLRYQIQTNQDKGYQHEGTKLKNYQAFLKSTKVHTFDSNLLAMAININNYEDLIHLLDYKKYYKLLIKIHSLIKAEMKDNEYIYQIDNRSFWIRTQRGFEYEPLIQLLNRYQFILDDIPLYVNFSMGIAFSDSVKPCEAAFQESQHAALAASKKKLNYLVYDAEQETRSKHLSMLGKVRDAIKHEEFVLVYHPIMNLKNNIVEGIEALVRWQKDDKQLMPLDFIPLLEETILIDDLTDYIVQKVLKDYPKIVDAYPGISMAINLSQRNLYNPKLISQMIEKFSKTDGKFFVEMTESAMMLNSHLSKSLLYELDQVGVGTILDDFGIGYSSLSHLSEFQLKKVKLDQSFIFDLEQSDHQQYLVKTIINLAHDLKLEVVAEGVEKETTLNLLKGFKCDQAQGFYFTQALDLEKLILWLNKQTSTPE